MIQEKGKLPFCGLTLRLYSTGNKSPKFEFQASSNKAQFQCTITKKLYSIFELSNWLNSPEVQEYTRSGHVLKWGSKTQQGEATKYSNGETEDVTCFMVKPFVKTGYTPQPQQEQNYQQAKQGYQLTDDKLPSSPSDEIDWAKENATDFNPDQYEQELG